MLFDQLHMLYDTYNMFYAAQYMFRGPSMLTSSKLYGYNAE